MDKATTGAVVEVVDIMVHHTMTWQMQLVPEVSVVEVGEAIPTLKIVHPKEEDRAVVVLEIPALWAVETSKPKVFRILVEMVEQIPAEAAVVLDHPTEEGVQEVQES